MFTLAAIKLFTNSDGGTDGEIGFMCSTALSVALPSPPDRPDGGVHAAGARLDTARSCFLLHCLKPPRWRVMEPPLLPGDSVRRRYDDGERFLAAQKSARPSATVAAGILSNIRVEPTLPCAMPPSVRLILSSNRMCPPEPDFRRNVLPGKSWKA